ncbi:hypothetical protein ACLOJK_041941 [Asimina triloba]
MVDGGRWIMRVMGRVWPWWMLNGVEMDSAHLVRSLLLDGDGSWAGASVGPGGRVDRFGVAGRRCLAVNGLPGRWQLLVKADRAAEDACRRILGAVRHGGKLDRAALPVGDENGEDGGCQHDLGVMGSGEMLVGVACLGCSWWRTARSGWRAWSVRTLLG